MLFTHSFLCEFCQVWPVYEQCGLFTRWSLCVTCVKLCRLGGWYVFLCNWRYVTTDFGDYFSWELTEMEFSISYVILVSCINNVITCFECLKF